MTREIKFRGKVTHGDLKGQWVYGSFVNYPDNPTIVNIIGSYNIDPATLGQFTGLEDKNGVEIYKGDLLKNGSGRIGEVIWHNHAACFDLMPVNSIGHPGGSACNQWKFVLEIIGNIHDNLELMGATK